MKQSTITLTSFCVFTKDKKGNINLISGGSDSRRNGDATEILIASLPMESMAIAPPAIGSALTMLYGHRDRLEQLHYYRHQARKVGAEFASVDFEVNVGSIKRGHVDPLQLASAMKRGTRFQHMRLLRPQFQREVIESFVEGDPNQDTSLIGRMKLLGRHPSAYDSVQDASNPNVRLLSELDVMVIPVSDTPTGSPRYVARVAPGASFVSEVQTREDVRLILPSWMGASLYKKERQQA